MEDLISQKILAQGLLRSSKLVDGFSWGDVRDPAPRHSRSFEAHNSPDKADVFYTYRDSGIWYPETICKPFLKAACQETMGWMAKWNVLQDLMRPSEDTDGY
jgi:hypothetical protein